MALCSKPIVLIVEDEALVRLIAADILCGCGAKVIEAKDADEALCILEADGSVDLVFTDINMPGSMDGFALAERIHAIKPGVELIMTSARDRFQDDDLPDHATFLPKPYVATELCRLLEDKLGVGKVRSGAPIDPA